MTNSLRMNLLQNANEKPKKKTIATVPPSRKRNGVRRSSNVDRNWIVDEQPNERKSRQHR